MHEDLLRRALESKKTTSRKQQSRGTSAAASLSNSRQGSRAGSRAGSTANSTTASAAGSDDEDLSDESMSVGLASVAALLKDGDWEGKLSEAIEAILGGKAGREALGMYLYILRTKIAGDEIAGQTGELCRAFMKIGRGQDENDAVAAMRCIGVTVVSDSSEDYIDVCAKSLEHIASTAQDVAVKAAAICAYGAVHFFGGLDQDELAGPLEWLAQVISSDGDEVDALDSGQVVAAALEEWALLLTLVDDLKFFPRDPFHAVVEQVESASIDVQIAAGQALALIYSASYAKMEDMDEDEIPRDVTFLEGRKLQRFEPLADKDDVLARIDAILKTSAKRMAKKNKRSLHAVIQQAKYTVEDPTVPPGVNPNAVDEDGNLVASRLSQRVNNKTEIGIDEWWMLVRQKEMKRILGPGLREHLDQRPELVEEVFGKGCLRSVRAAEGEGKERRRDVGGRKGEIGDVFE